jgi:hypothetical protein
MADQHLLADQGRQAGLVAGARRIDVDDAAVLEVGPSADADAVDVAAQHAIVPDARFRADLDVADQAGAGGDEGGGIEERRLAAEREQGDVGQWAGAGHDARDSSLRRPSSQSSRVSS